MIFDIVYSGSTTIFVEAVPGDAEHMADLLWGYYPPEGQRVVCFGGYYNALEFENVVS